MARRLQPQVIRIPAAVLAALLVSLASPCANAQEPAAPKTEQRDKTASELDALLKAATLSEERVKALDAEIDALKRDETAVTAALIQSGKTERKLTEDVARIETRLEAQQATEQGIRVSLRARRSVLAEVLAALQRMGLNPPPALLVNPEDALSSVRSAILLGAVVPELRGETERLITDLDALKRVTISISNERSSLLTSMRMQTEERHRLGLLVAEKQKLRAETEANLETEKKNAEAFAKKARNLKDLIASLEKDMAAEEKAAERARREEEKRLALERRMKEAETEAAMLAPGASLARLRGELVLPVSGKIARPFGADDGFGGTTAGISVAAAPASLVSAPVDATVLYAGPFRSYHQLLILDAGDGYHVVMGGMDQTMVSVGQFVLSGEPVGLMAIKPPPSSQSNSVSANSVSAADLTDATELYIEFRKDGVPVDSAPWWSAQAAGRT
jgi:murein hydrolase activator